VVGGISILKRLRLIESDFLSIIPHYDVTYAIVARNPLAMWLQYHRTFYSSTRVYYTHTPLCVMAVLASAANYITEWL
jgi:hypothetical protein